jgi:hypothetical protein
VEFKKENDDIEVVISFKSARIKSETIFSCSQKIIQNKRVTLSDAAENLKSSRTKNQQLTRPCGAQ